MWIICVYAINVVIGEAAVLAIGLYLDRIVPTASLTISITLFFVVLWSGWVLAVRWTLPKPIPGGSVAAHH